MVTTKPSSIWIPVPRDYVAEQQQSSKPRVAATLHPLKKVIRDDEDVKPKQTAAPPPPPSSDAPVIFDPLGAMTNGPNMFKEKTVLAVISTPTAVSEEKKVTDFEPWSAKKAGILSKYTTSSVLPVWASFLTDVADVKETSNKAVSADKVKSRLEMLDAMDDRKGQHISFLSQQEYIKHIESMHQELIHAWEAEERVTALKIVIQCAKMLGDASVPQFYPSMFVLVTEILDTFGSLVFERLKRRAISTSSSANGQPAPLGENFLPEDVPAEAQETSKNWFFKCACIRELLPRFYIETALLSTYRFLWINRYPATLTRLSNMIRGIGDPLVATYARSYLARVGRQVCPSSREYLLGAIGDNLFAFADCKSFFNRAPPQSQTARMPFVDYLDLMAPAFQWMMQCIGYNGSEASFDEIVKTFKAHCNHAMVLRYILESYPASMVSRFAMTFAGMIAAAEEGVQAKAGCYIALGRAFLRSPPPREHRMNLINEIWAVVTTFSNVQEYIEIAEVYIEYVLKNFSQKEVNAFMKDIIKHVKATDFKNKLQHDKALSILEKIMNHSADLSVVLSLDSFLPLIDQFPPESKARISKSILDSFAKQQANATDLILIHTLFDIAKALHDSVDSLSFEDERRQIARLICIFIQKIDLGNDLEQLLNIYTDARGAFTNLEPVIHQLVLSVLTLCMKAHKFVKGKHSKKTLSFVKACLSYAHITIPSIADYPARMTLNLLGAELALQNQLLGQANTLAKAAITLISEIPEFYNKPDDSVRRSSESDVVSFVNSLCSLLVVFPGHPEFGPFHLIEGLYNAVLAYSWPKGGLGKGRALLSLLTVLCCNAQEKLPYHIDRVESNDSLYGADPEFALERQQFVDKIIDDLVAIMTEMSQENAEKDKTKRLATLAVDFAGRIPSLFEMNLKTGDLLTKFLGLAKRNGVDVKLYNSTVAHVTYVLKEGPANIPAIFHSQSVEYRRVCDAILTKLAQIV